MTARKNASKSMLTLEAKDCTMKIRVTAAALSCACGASCLAQSPSLPASSFEVPSTIQSNLNNAANNWQNQGLGPGQAIGSGALPPPMPAPPTANGPAFGSPESAFRSGGLPSVPPQDGYAPPVAGYNLPQSSIPQSNVPQNNASPLNIYIPPTTPGSQSTTNPWSSSDIQLPCSSDSVIYTDPDIACRTERRGWFDEFTGLIAIDGSKQPHDFGVNANAGVQASFNWGIPILRDWGIGAQIGSNMTATQNAVRVFELLGETRSRTQNFTTVGAFQRLDNGFAWGGAYDFLYQDSYDNFSLGQWRLRTSYDLGRCNQVGATAQLRAFSDDGIFGAATPVTLRPINQGSLYWRRFWGTGAQTTGWLGIADGHGENNAAFGPSPAKTDSFLFGADIFMPLNASWAIYGETNMITPLDTGTVDAFLGLQWFPGGRAFQARRGKFNPLLPTASPTSFAVDLIQ